MDIFLSMHLEVLHFFLEIMYKLRFPDVAQGMVTIFVNITERSK